MGLMATPKTLRDIYSGVDKSDKKRRKNDFYPTPPLATWCLLKHSNVPDNILEPCAGSGNISIELERNGKNVYSQDLNEYDNLLTRVTPGIDIIENPIHSKASALITNPPYHKDLPRKIAQLGIDNYDYTALLVRLTFLEGKKRRKLFNKHPPSQIIIFSDRLKFGEFDDREPIEQEEQIGGMICYMWIVWDKGSVAETKVKWISLEDEYSSWRSHYDQTREKEQTT